MSKKEILEACQNRITPYIHRTPVLTSTAINDLVGASLFFKCENFQRMGAFKMRGATNAIMQLSDAQKQRGVVTHSSGNFAQAVSLAAKNLGISAEIVMPSNAPAVKQNAVIGYEGKITLCEPTLEARENAAQKIVADKGATFIHPSNDIDVIYGNATAAMELLEDQSELEILFAPIGGGGLIAGTALAAHFFGKNCSVIGAEPEEVNDAYRSLQSGKIEQNKSANTIADGLRTTLGTINFPIIQNYVDHIITVTEEQIIAAMKLIWERMKIIVEPSSAVALAAIIANKATFQNKKLGIIISGGNVDLKNLPF
ncbi:pyridoxal-phosphate dependent enzyme [Aurantibacter crassamenti]|uniref:pyridoxal-phosphate dependent enzyme n=1 Tax=Aurantibacter crassamenti TaxID=1837375 RepID=UPI00193A0FFD|nr:pyridoxal-phosphate dependent enzyme [Aurantibacter crassamenti]MBM1107723.1 pyridoxal-phosphate dependent enzyme [Aurantibacter crassamenti]